MVLFLPSAATMPSSMRRSYRARSGSAWFTLMGRFATGSSQRSESHDAPACSSVIVSAAVDWMVSGRPTQVNGTNELMTQIHNAWRTSDRVGHDDDEFGGARPHSRSFGPRNGPQGGLKCSNYFPDLVCLAMT